MVRVETSCGITVVMRSRVVIGSSFSLSTVVVNLVVVLSSGEVASVVSGAVTVVTLATIVDDGPWPVVELNNPSVTKGLGWTMLVVVAAEIVELDKATVIVAPCMITDSVDI